ncbi:Restriction endonuclease S subunit [Halanaeroarchaeum sp. HSR-CO]|uniref:restriction endonuclease subunit S n=1 Tax=Halanaeroarchaeum sp. HSR-CO TaxID=2866382 RepID=UPI00217DAD50|nr:restriction endonuclease subunit S [Halanaeroarchaeum sp. HSR-CO]UWG46775.1 Restriction endonuclease S subunit [Halanaeroarchaeum sp. HSR-CO]
MNEAISEEGAAEGYKQVHLGPRKVEIPEAWEKTQLGELGEYLNGYGFKSSDWSNEGRPIIRIQNLTNSAGEETNYYKGEIKDRYIVHEGDLLVSWSATLGVFIWDGPEALLNQHIFKVAPSERVSEDFLYYLLDHNLDLLEMRVQGSTMKHIRKSTFEDTFVPLPPLSEQHRIANIFSRVDEQIQQTDEIIEKHRELREGLLHDLFHRGAVKHDRILGPEELADKPGGVNTGLDQTTVGQIPERWEAERLGELTVASAYGVNASAEDFDSEKPRYIRITDIADDGHLKQDDPKSISRLQSEGYELQNGDLLFARTGATVGKTLLYQEDYPEAAYAGYLIRFQLDQERILPKFVFYFTQTDNYDRWVSRITRQGAQENINTGEYASILLPLPPIAEQQKIVSILEIVDQKISQERDTKQNLKELKRGLMQDLLTGKVRVNTD